MGKVHGSLARAGKVKSQTPKVRCIVMIRKEWGAGLQNYMGGPWQRSAR
jgi:Ribosomal protein S30